MAAGARSVRSGNGLVLTRGIDGLLRPATAEPEAPGQRRDLALRPTQRFCKGYTVPAKAIPRPASPTSPQSLTHRLDSKLYSDCSLGLIGGLGHGVGNLIHGPPGIATGMQPARPRVCRQGQNVRATSPAQLYTPHERRTPHIPLVQAVRDGGQKWASPLPPHPTPPMRVREAESEDVPRRDPRHTRRGSRIVGGTRRPRNRPACRQLERRRVRSISSRPICEVLSFESGTTMRSCPGCGRLARVTRRSSPGHSTVAGFVTGNIGA
jgi:hypothetical protein